MARINLLPWRQAERERKNKEFLMVALAIAAVAVLGVLAAMFALNNMLSDQQAANQAIEIENQRLDEMAVEIAGLEQQRDEMLARMKVIQDLQGQRSVPVRVWDDIARAIPQAMYLVNMKREGDVITLSGFADNPNVVSQLIRNLDASPWLSNSGMPSIQTDAQAYQLPSSKAQDVAKQDVRPVYPEDSYIEFTVTTQVKPDVPADPNVDPNAPVDPNAVAASTAPEAQGQQSAPAPAQPDPASAPAPAPQAAPAPAQPDPASAPAQPAGGQ